MQQLENLVRDAQALSKAPAGQPVRWHGAVLGAEETEVARVMQICNACRYCEGFCAVFPAMTRRLEFGKADVNYLANLCHNWRLPACLPVRATARVRRQRAAGHGQGARADLRRLCLAGAAGAGCTSATAWSCPLAVAAGIALFLALAAVMVGGLFHEPGRQFLCRVSAQHAGADVRAGVRLCRVRAGHGRGALLARRQSGRRRGAAVAEPRTTRCACATWTAGTARAATTPTTPSRCGGGALYGFMLCFAATCVATLYHYFLGEPAPYPFWSAPVLLGTVGGVGLLVARPACCG